VEGATRFRGRRPCIATRLPGARSAIDPSTCRQGVWRGAPSRGKSDPSRVCDTRVGDPDDRGALQDCVDGAGVPRRPTCGGRQSDTPTSNMRGPDHTRRRSQRGGDSVGRFFGEAACPRSVPPKPWHKREDGLGVSEREAVTRARRISPGPHLSFLSLRARPTPHHRRGRGRCRVWWTHRTRPQPLGKPHRTRFPTTAHTSHISWMKKQEHGSQTRTARRPPSRFTRSQLTADKDSFLPKESG